jgi:hypothetical protein
MKKFVHDENMKLFRKQLDETTDPEKRRVLLKLLAEEKANDRHSPLADYPIFDAYCGLRSDIARGPKSAANSRHHHARFE